MFVVVCIHEYSRTLASEVCTGEPLIKYIDNKYFIQ